MRAWAPSWPSPLGSACARSPGSAPTSRRQRWLGPLARLEAISAWALTEPDHGSDSVSLETRARRDGGLDVLDGEKKWIGNATIADVVIVWARDDADGKVKGFLVERGTPGFEASRIEGKGAVAGRLAGRDPHGRRTDPRREPPARCDLVWRRREAFSPRRDKRGVGVARPRRPPLRGRARVLPAARRSSAPLVQLPARAGQAGAHARRPLGMQLVCLRLAG